MIASLTGQGNNARHACRFLGVTESGYYAWRSRPTSPRALRRIFLASEIVDVHRASAAPRNPGWLTEGDYIDHC